MSDQYDNTNTGVLFKNDKGDNDKRPDYKGRVNCGGVDFKLSAWIREKKDGSGKYMSLKVEQHDTAKAKPATAAPAAPAAEENDIQF